MFVIIIWAVGLICITSGRFIGRREEHSLSKKTGGHHLPPDKTPLAP